MLISNGLGTPHHAWPDINRRTDTYRVMTWDHRGLGGSERPSDESRINISDHTDDLFAVMDSYGVDRAVVIGWSAGVNVAFEAVVRQPQRIAGVLAVGGVPGGTFEALLHPLPGFLRPPAGRVGSHLMRYLGPVLNRLGDGLPGSPEHGFDPRGVATLGLDVIHGHPRSGTAAIRRPRLAVVFPPRRCGRRPPVHGPERDGHTGHVSGRCLGCDRLGATDAGRQRADATQSLCRTCRHTLYAAAVSEPCVSRARRPR